MTRDYGILDEFAPQNEIKIKQIYLINYRSFSEIPCNRSYLVINIFLFEWQISLIICFNINF